MIRGLLCYDAEVDRDQDLFSAGRNCWRVEEADRLAVVIDAAAYFEALHQAMAQARRRIMLIGWDFDSRIRLIQPRSGSPPATVGKFILWLAKKRPDLEIYLLRWDMGLATSLLRGSMPLMLLRWKMHRQIHFKLDSAQPIGGSHHQKIVAIDDCLAFCGGIDVTSRRWDTREHRDDDPRRVSPGGRHHDPWHDAIVAFDGKAAAALGELARDRWEFAGGERLEPVEGARPCWPEALDPDFRNLRVAIARSRPEYGGREAVREIEDQTVDLIAAAKRSLYVESQYFASRKLAEAIARRLDEPDGPEIVLINPHQSDGWLEQQAMDTARARLYEALHRRDRHGRFRIYHPFTAGGRPIYVHAKIVIVDDRILRVGSSNWNNRSMRLDTECDATIDALLASDPEQSSRRIRAIRDGLIAEHLAVEQERVEQAIARHGSLISAIDALAGEGRSLRSYEVPDLAEIEKYLADHEVLDPEGPEEMFEPVARRHLFRRLRKPRDDS